MAGTFRSSYGGSMARRERRKLTAEEIAKIEAWSVVRLPLEEMCDLLNYNVTDLREMSKRDDAVRRALRGGRAKASAKVRRTLYERAVGRKASRDPKTGEVIEAIDVDFQALKFWCQTQEGFRTTDKLELSGPEGSPIETHNVTKEELKTRLLALRAANDLTDDE